MRTVDMSITADKKKLRKIARLLKEFCDKHKVSINATAFGTCSGIGVAHTDGNFYAGCFLDFDYAPGGVVKFDGESLS